MSKTEPIWWGEDPLARLRRPQPGLVGLLGIEFTDIGPDYLTATMGVNDKTLQPLGVLHGGASVTLAETLGSTAGYLCIDPSQSQVLGLEINANHVRAMTDGVVTGTAKPVHLGKTTQVWSIRIADQRDRTVCVSRLTLAVRPKRRRPS